MIKYLDELREFMDSVKATNLLQPHQPQVRLYMTLNDSDYQTLIHEIEREELIVLAPHKINFIGAGDGFQYSWNGMTMYVHRT